MKLYRMALHVMAMVVCLAPFGSGAAVVWTEDFSTSTTGSAPNTANGWGTPSTTAGVVDVFDLGGSTGNALRIVDTSGGSLSIIPAGMSSMGFNTSNAAQSTLAVSFDWRLDSISGAVPFRFQLADNGNARFSIGYGTDGANNFYFWGMSGNYTAINSASAIGALASGSTFSSSTGGFVHFDVTYVDHATTALVTMTSGANVFSYTITGITGSTYGDNINDNLIFTSGSSGMGTSYFDNMVVQIVPEPSVFSLTALAGICGLACWRLNNVRPCRKQ